MTLLPLNRIASAGQVPKVVSLCGSRVRGEQWRLGRREEGMNVLIKISSILFSSATSGLAGLGAPSCDGDFTVASP